MPGQKFESAHDGRSPNAYSKMLGANAGSRVFEKPSHCSPNVYSSLNLRSGEKTGSSMH